MTVLPDPKTLASLVSSVTQTMLGLSFAPSDLAAEIKERQMDLGFRTAILPIAGKRAITIGLSSDKVGCTALSAAMFSCPTDKVDGPMMDDSLAELLNMTAGQIKSAMALDQALGLPKIVQDRDVGKLRNVPWKSVALRAGPVELVVWLAEQTF